jgi:hypothetical protein
VSGRVFGKGRTSRTDRIGQLFGRVFGNEFRPGKGRVRGSWSSPVISSGAASSFIDGLASTLNCRASYTGVPWVSTPSAGVNGGNLTTEGGTPSVGTALDGYTPARFNSATSDGLITTQDASHFLAVKAATMVIYFKATSAAAPGAAFSDTQILVDNDTDFGITLSTDGLSVSVQNGAKRTTAIPCSTGAWHMGVFRFDGANINCRMDTTDATPVADTNDLPVVGNNILVGCRNTFGGLDGLVAEVQLFNTVLSNATLTSMYNEYKTKYPST